MKKDIKEHLQNPSSWKRLLYMILFWILYNIAETVLVGVVILQFLISLFTGSRNKHLLIFGKQLSKYIYDVMIFLTYNSEHQAFPFSEWPTTESKSQTEVKSSHSNNNN